MVLKLMNLSVFLLRFYGKNSSYVHGGLDNNGKPAEAVYGQSVSGFINSFYTERLSALHSHTPVKRGTQKTHSGFLEPPLSEKDTFSVSSSF